VRRQRVLDCRSERRAAAQGELRPVGGCLLHVQLRCRYDWEGTDSAASAGGTSGASIVGTRSLRA
jgi:hypothetical protein